MAPRTRRSNQASASPSATATPTTPSTVLFGGSSKASKTVSPDTSDIDNDDDTLPVTKPQITIGRQTRASVAKGKNKRAQESESEVDKQDGSAQKRAPKRRAITRTAFVEVPAISTKLKGKVRTSLPSDCSRMLS